MGVKPSRPIRGSRIERRRLALVEFPDLSEHSEVEACKIVFLFSRPIIDRLPELSCADRIGIGRVFGVSNALGDILCAARL